MVEKYNAKAINVGKIASKRLIGSLKIILRAIGNA
jgi:hypothetical protein